MQSAAGRLLVHIADIDAALQLPGFACTFDDIDAESWRALRVLWSERDKYSRERQKDAEMKARSQEAEGRAQSRGR
jgi:hypothetical protein